jgi:hypothetical protein
MLVLGDKISGEFPWEEWDFCYFGQYAPWLPMRSSSKTSGKIEEIKSLYPRT